MRQKNPSRRHKVDLGLSVIETVRRPGESLTCAEIAEVCGCSHQAIRQILKRAVEKLRRRAVSRQR